MTGPFGLSGRGGFLYYALIDAVILETNFPFLKCKIEDVVIRFISYQEFCVDRRPRVAFKLLWC